MGLCAHAKGLTAETEFDCGYLTYGLFLRNLAHAYNEEIGEMFESMCRGNLLSEQQESRWNEICNDDLDLLLFHSDCDGKFTPQIREIMEKRNQESGLEEYYKCEIFGLCKVMDKETWDYGAAKSIALDGCKDYEGQTRYEGKTLKICDYCKHLLDL